MLDKAFQKEPSLLHTILCYFDKHVFLRRYKGEYVSAFLYGSYGDEIGEKEEKMCFWCKVYYKDGVKVRDNFYDF
jgi:hypothetical protein